MKRKWIERQLIAELDVSIVETVRDRLHADTLERYARMVAEDETGWAFNTKVLVARVAGDERGTKYVIDGLHRIRATEMVEGDTVVCDMYEADDLDEIKRAALTANTKHGEKLTREELQRAVKSYLEAGGDKESDSAVARAFGIDRGTVAKYRVKNNIPTRTEAVKKAVEKAKKENPGASERELAKVAGVTRDDVRASKRKVGEIAENPQFTPPVTAKPTGVERPAQHPKEKAQKPVFKPVLDDVGNEVPPDLWTAWKMERETVADWLHRAQAIKREICKAMEGAEGVPAMHALRSQQFAQFIVDKLDAAIAGLKDVKPEALCTCEGLGCKRCGMRGWMTRDQYKRNIPEAEQ